MSDTATIRALQSTIVDLKQTIQVQQLLIDENRELRDAVIKITGILSMALNPDNPLADTKALAEINGVLQEVTDTLLGKAEH